MPFDGTNGPFPWPRRDRRSASAKVQRALRGWRPIQRSERARRWKRTVVTVLRALGLSRRAAAWAGGHGNSRHRLLESGT